MAMAWVSVQEWTLDTIDSMARRWRGVPGAPAHLETGERGERKALFHLRRMGYTVVARRWKNAKLWGDVDLIAWDGEWLCFVEVKTRAARDGITAESAVDRDKQKMLRRMARAYLRRFPEKLRGDVAVRFDVVSVYMLPSGTEFELHRGAFGW